MNAAPVIRSRKREPSRIKPRSPRGRVIGNTARGGIPTVALFVSPDLHIRYPPSNPTQGVVVIVYVHAGPPEAMELHSEAENFEEPAASVCAENDPTTVVGAVGIVERCQAFGEARVIGLALLNLP